MEGTFLAPSSRARGHRASASSALLQELERTAANASSSSGGRGSLGISRELSKLINKKTPTMTKEQVLRKVRQGGLRGNAEGGEEEEEEEECVEGLTLYETYREPIAPPEDPNHTTTLQVRMLNVELTCPICLGIMRQTMTVMECLHRFCDECISKCLRWGKKECPTCRVHCSSRRHLRPDPNFDALIATVYPNLDEYEAQEQEFIADINKRMNRKSLTDSVEKGLMRQMAASRGPRGKRDKEQLEAMETPSTNPSSSSSRKRKSTSAPAASSSSSGLSSSSSSTTATTRASNKNSKRSKSQDARQRNGGLEQQDTKQPEMAAVSLELDASGIPLTHYHIPHKRVSSSSSSSSSSSPSSSSSSSSADVASFLSRFNTLISFLLLPHPDDERLSAVNARGGGDDELAGAGAGAATATPPAPSNLALQRPYLRTSRKVTVAQIADFLASKFPQLPLSAPSSFDLLVPPRASATTRADSATAASPQQQQPSTQPETRFTISILPTAAVAAAAAAAATMTTSGEQQEERSDTAVVEAAAEHVALEDALTIDAVASRFWDGKGDLTLYYRLAA